MAYPPRSGHLPALTGRLFFLAPWVIFTDLIGTGHVYEPIVLLLPVPLQDLIRRGYQAVPTFSVLLGFRAGKDLRSDGMETSESPKVSG